MHVALRAGLAGLGTPLQLGSAPINGRRAKQRRTTDPKLTREQVGRIRSLEDGRRNAARELRAVFAFELTSAIAAAVTLDQLAEIKRRQADTWHLAMDSYRQRLDQVLAA